ncbi:MAG TPA: PQQ-dependent sugar dehydrogenase [Candidatus Limnocylindrales bacterium]|nr:PQQ-dependent sugar dehydrogenase [Candidatus Limnocylindrales bacterium]
MLPRRRLAGLGLAAALVTAYGSSQPTPPPTALPTAVPPTAATPSEVASPSPDAPAGTPPASPAPSGSFDPGGVAIGLEPLVEGLEAPLGVVNAGDGSGRIFVVEKGGRIRIVHDGRVAAEPFLDISANVSRGGEQGLLGLAFHPDFPDDPRFFVNYTDAAGDTHIAAFTVDPANPDRADAGSEEQVLFVDQPYGNHNGGVVAFGPDGYLYVGLGDGGSGGDPHGNGQKLASRLAKVLRIDVDARAGGRAYAIPADNPFASRSGAAPEVFALGLRNPWRFSFDRETADLWIGDVGQGAWEEVDVVRAGTSGQNFGWNRMEGAHCYRPSEGCDPGGLTPPVAEYSHKNGCTVIGGFVYRGAAQPALAGGYLFADYCSGAIWAIDPTSDGPTEPTVVGQTEASLTSFGEDEAGELYATDIRGGQLLRVIANPR